MEAFTIKLRFDSCHRLFCKLHHPENSFASRRSSHILGLVIYFSALLITALALPSPYTVATTTTPHEARSFPSLTTGNDAFSSADGISKKTIVPSIFGIACFTQPAHLPHITSIITVDYCYASVTHVLYGSWSLTPEILSGTRD